MKCKRSKNRILLDSCLFVMKKANTHYHYHQGPRSLRKCAGAEGGTIFLGDFLLHFCAICKNDPFSKSENVPGLKPWLPGGCGAPAYKIL